MGDGGVALSRLCRPRAPLSAVCGVLTRTIDSAVRNLPILSALYPMKHFCRLAVVSLVGACSSELAPEPKASSVTPANVQVGPTAARPSASVRSKQADHAALMARVDAIDAAIAEWGGARTLAEAKAGAEEARNLITGSNGPGYGDLDGDGTISGQVEVGLLPGLAGQAGLASASPNPCTKTDVLGGDFSQAAARWATMDRAIADWRADNNTFPSLPSHPQRIVGWASLTLQSADLGLAREYAGHAQMHADKTRTAITRCKT